MTDVTSVEVFDGSNDNEMLRRQVHPNHLKPGTNELERTAFTPRWKSDEADGRMSHLRKTVTAAEAWRRHTEDNGLQSAGTWPMLVGYARNDLELNCGDDSNQSHTPPDHCFVELPSTHPSKRETSRLLARWASAAGPLFTPLEQGAMDEGFVD